MRTCPLHNLCKQLMTKSTFQHRTECMWLLTTLPETLSIFQQDTTHRRPTMKLLPFRNTFHVYTRYSLLIPTTLRTFQPDNRHRLLRTQEQTFLPHTMSRLLEKSPR